MADLADNTDVLFEQARASCRQGRLSEGVDFVRRVLALDPKQARAHNLLGMALNGLGRREEALASFDQAIACQPELADAHGNRGDVLIDLGRPSEALESYDRALGIAPHSVETWCNRGAALQALGRHQEALECYDQAIARKADFPELQLYRGNCMIELGRPADALACFDQTLDGDPRNVAALHNRGFALKMLNRHHAALASYDQVLKIEPQHVDAINNRGVSLFELGCLPEALASYDQALALQPGHLHAWSGRGVTLLKQERYEQALASCDRAVALQPDNVNALYLRALVLMKLDRYDAALVSAERALALNPDFPDLLSTVAHIKGFLCRWDDHEQLTRQMENAVTNTRTIVSPFALLGYSSDPAIQLESSRRWVGHFAPAEMYPTVPAARPEASHDDRLRIAYLSADFHEHATAYLTAELFERHDRRRFEIVGISFGPDDGSAMRARLKKALDRFEDVSREGDAAVAQRLRELQVHIAVDLKGLTGGGRLGILAQRPAPIQVSYLGYPGSVGADFIDYAIADKIAAPFDQQPYFTEKIIHLPDSYQVNDSKRAIASFAPARAELGLASDGFVFCCFNHSWKINPPVFDVWMRLLQDVEGSVLWLLKSNASAADNLQREAERRGVDPKRLVFAAHAKLPDHLARLQRADLFLDTLPCNAHTTASDALWAGVPIVTCAGATFAGRVAASLLHAAGLPDLVTANLDEYESLARRLALDPSLLHSLRGKLQHGRSNMPLFDTGRFRRHLETAYETMWDIHRRGERPRNFSVDPIPA